VLYLIFDAAGAVARVGKLGEEKQYNPRLHHLSFSLIKHQALEGTS